jgi:hypothetical protein
MDLYIECPENITAITSIKQSPVSTGHYCPEGTTIPVPCPAGTFAALENNAAESDCLNCTAGSYCQGN